MPDLIFRGASLLKIVKDFVLHELLWSAVPLAGRGAASRRVVASDGVDTLGGVQEDVQRAIFGTAAGHLDGPGGGPCSGTGRWLQPVAQVPPHFGASLSLESY